MSIMYYLNELKKVSRTYRRNGTGVTFDVNPV